MNKTAWSQPVTNQTAARRAGGRQRINAQRQALAGRRQFFVVLLFQRGWRPAAIATLAGVHLVTVYRDLWRRYGKLRKPRKI